ncbi:MAG: imidazole glycerol phosphate synthase subunit HisH [Opitutales bacterium]|nr:imidazole glycerol phosphate synthase subunit HisH [Opitutales bacterium]
MGNLRSVVRAWEHAGADVSLVDTPAGAGSADALVFPGQGAIVDAMRQLRATGFDRLIRSWAEADKPFFGICLGLQALFEHSEEGDTPALGILPGRVRRFSFSAESGLKIPHMGWNAVAFRGAPADDPLLAGIGARDGQFYFVHSYYAEPAKAAGILGSTRYGDLDFCSAVRRGRLVATQFHPEKSQAVGLTLYRNFLQTL